LQREGADRVALLGNLERSIDSLEAEAAKRRLATNKAYGDEIKVFFSSVRDAAKTTKAAYVRDEMLNLPGGGDLATRAKIISILACPKGANNYGTIQALEEAAKMLERTSRAPSFFRFIARSIELAAASAKRVYKSCESEIACRQHLHCDQPHTGGGNRIHQDAHANTPPFASGTPRRGGKNATVRPSSA
jgi:hypothetical protein